MNRFFLLLLLIICFTGFGQITNNTETPIQTVERIFKNYIKYSESTDSKDNKNLMIKSLKLLQKKCTHKELKILINVWMYYDPTDFQCRELIEPVFYKNKSVTLLEVDKYLKEKKKWEHRDTAPYTDLINLRIRLSN